MKKVIGMLVALAVFCAMPAVAFSQVEGDGDTVSSGDATVRGGDVGAGGYDGGGYDGGGYDGGGYDRESATGRVANN